MELVCARSCAIASLGASSSCSGSRTAASLSCRRPLRVAAPRRAGRGRRRAAGEEGVGTEEAEKPIVTSEADGGSNNGNGYPASTSFPTGRKWTGYVEKDTAGQTNIYAVEPTVYVADSVLSSGEAGDSTEGTSNTVAIAFGFGLVAVASAASILLTVGKKAPAPVTEVVGYDGPPLSYYVSKFSQAPVGVTVEDSAAAAAPELTTEGTSSVVDEASV